MRSALDQSAADGRPPGRPIAVDPDDVELGAQANCLDRRTGDLGLDHEHS